ncbi:hypothetical protein BZG02_08330 [Labilibaculum filiforme]|uniref:Uncharacterized protein n=1 Tax=Labilibaculum filiforme TaxID=1940526 RepID=A0A2N3HZG0_9BACT|nr:hypothetical protein [Labilibaculum filiforme]PKQ63383.1 hypothetical protein BZG02_08330 [Labilibaculum filiforme]
MDKKLYNTIQELGRSIQSAQENAKRQCTSPHVDPRSVFESELNYKMQQYVHNMHTYLNIDRVLGFPIQPINYSSDVRVSDRGVSIRVAIHHYPPVKPMIIEAPEMILELRATVDSNGRMEYQFSNYFANPTDLKALAPHLPEGSCLILLEDGSLSVEELEEPGVGPSFSEPNYSMTGGDASSNGDGYGWDDAASNTFSVMGAAGSGSKAILDNRGAYMPRGQIYKVNKPVTVRTPVVNINTTSKVLNTTRVAGKVCVVAGVVTTGISVYNDIDNGDYYSAGTRTAVYGVAAGVAFIPVVGWGLSIGIGVADAVWGDQFYNWVETKMGD